MNPKTNTQDQILDLLNSISALSTDAQERWRALIPKLNEEQLSQLLELFTNKLTKLADDFRDQVAEYRTQQNRKILTIAEDSKEQKEKSDEDQLLSEIENL